MNTNLRRNPKIWLMLGFLLLFCAACGPALVVNSAADDPDNNLGDGTCLTANNECTLRAAIMEANAGSGGSITFENVGTISIAGSLPPITASNVTINGAGAVTLDGGQNLSCGVTTGLELRSSNNVIQGMNIINFGTGINLNAFSSVVKNNIIGYKPSSAAPASEQRNVIGGTCRGIYIDGQNAFGNTVSGNYVGTDASGATANPNKNGILLLNGAHDNVIGALTSSSVASFNTANLAAYWNLDEASGSALDAQASNDLAETSGTIDSVAGISGTARDFELADSEYFTLADSPELSTGDIDFTWSVWVKLESNATDMWVIHKGIAPGFAGGSEYLLSIPSSDHQPRFYVGNGSSFGTATWGAPLSNGIWYHIVGWHDSVNDLVGITVNNGAPVTAAYAGGGQDTAAPLLLAARNAASPNLNFDGVLDEVGFWKRVLTPADIAVLYNNGNGVAYSVDNPASNVISGNNAVGIYFDGAHNNHITGNYVGVTAGGFSPLGNVDGIALSDGSTGNTIGITVAGAGSPNVVSGNGQGAIQISDGSNNNIVAGNFIGTDRTGTIDLGNGGAGIFIYADSSGNVIGTNGDGAGDNLERNLISGNGKAYLGPGIWIDAANNLVAGNYIGTNIDGTVAFPNNGSGVSLSGNSNRVGTNGDGVSDQLEANLISGNATDGVFIGSAFNKVAGNLIGTNASGVAGLGNGLDGIRITAAGHDNIIGTNGDNIGDAAERNIISANAIYLGGSSGIGIQGGDNNIVAGNYIGLDAAGSASLGNLQFGISISSGADGNRIGTNGNGVADAAERNLISGNAWMGIYIAASVNNSVAGNYIGTDVTGSLAIPNGYGSNEELAGIEIAEASGNRVGTNGDGVADAAERNVISGNARSGVYINGVGSVNNTVAGNYIGTNAAGTVALSNGGIGVLISNGAGNNLIGSNGNGAADAAEANVISANTGAGVFIIGGASNHINRNFIGTDKTGTAPLGNMGDGVLITASNVGGSDGNTVGGTLQKANVIAFNAGYGVLLTGSGVYPTNTTILYNSIFSNGSIGISLYPDNAAFNVSTNDVGDGDGGANGLMNFPELDSALVLNNAITITGDMVDGLANTSFNIQFFYSAACDPSGFGEGQTYLGQSTQMTNGSGDVSFILNFGVNVPAGNFITATATSTNKTSEFSACVAVLAGAQFNLELDEPFVITPLRNLNCRQFCTAESEIADTLLEGIQYAPIGWDAITGFFAFEGPAFGELCFAPPVTGGTQLMALSLNQSPITLERLTSEVVPAMACPAFPTPTPTVDVDEGTNGTPLPPQCSDGLDNDADRFTDLADPQCRNANDNDEAVP